MLADLTVGGTEAFTTYRSHSVPSEVRFAIVRRKLERAGWVLQRISGSHHVFTKPGNRPVIVPVHHNKVKPVYAEKADKICREGDAEGGA